jgi:hypothetical protein
MYPYVVVPLLSVDLSIHLDWRRLQKPGNHIWITKKTEDAWTLSRLSTGRRSVRVSDIIADRWVEPNLTSGRNRVHNSA